MLGTHPRRPRGIIEHRRGAARGSPIKARPLRGDAERADERSAAPAQRPIVLVDAATASQQVVCLHYA